VIWVRSVAAMQLNGEGAVVDARSMDERETKGDEVGGAQGR
jgi:hypothetical protein